MPSNGWKAVFCRRRCGGNLSSKGEEEERARRLQSEDTARECCGEMSCTGWWRVMTGASRHASHDWVRMSTTWWLSWAAWVVAVIAPEASP
jgi:hypothetical protein